MADSQSFEYFAFISYSRKDSRIARWLHRKLESYRFPTKLVAPENHPPHRTYLRPIVRDKTDLEIDSKNFWENIEGKLDRSRFLIVLCSRNSAKSGYVSREIRHFLKRTGRTDAIDHIVPVIVEGNPGTGNEMECLPLALLELKEQFLSRNLPTMIPEAGEREASGWETGFLSTVAYLLHVAREKIADRYQREKQRQFRRILTGAGLLLSVFAVITAWALIERVQKEKARGEAVTNMNKANENARRANRQLALLYVERGHSSWDYGDRRIAIATFAQAYQAATNADDIGLRRQICSIIGARHSKTQSLLHNDHVSQIIYSVDGTKVVTVGGHTAQLWDVATGLPVGKLVAPLESGYRVAISPDGTKLAMEGADHAVRPWDVVTGQPLGRPLKHDQYLTAIAFSSDGVILATASNDNTARLWDVATGRRLGDPLNHAPTLNAVLNDVLFSPDDKTLVTLSESIYSAERAFWDVAKGKQIGEPMTHKGWVKTAKFSLDSKILAIGGGSAVSRWEVPTGHRLGEPLKHDDGVTGVAFSPDGTKFVTAGGHTAQLWDVATAHPLGEPLKHDDAVTGVAFSPDGTKLAIATASTFGSRGEARLWDVAKGKQIGEAMRHEVYLEVVAFSPDGTQLATVSGSGMARLWDLAIDHPLDQPFNCHVEAVAFSLDCRRMVTASGDGMARLWDVATRHPLGEPFKLNGAITAIALSPDGTKLATAAGNSGDEAAVQLWEAATGRPLGTPLKDGRMITAVAFSPDGTKLATGSEYYKGGAARLWDIATSSPLGDRLKHDGSVRAVAFSPDGKTLASASYDAVTRLWDVATGHPLGGPFYAGNLRSLAFSPDGTKLATASQLVSLWDVATRNRIGDPMKHDGPVQTVAFSLDGMKLATAGYDNTARLWDVATGHPICPPLKHTGRVVAAAFNPEGTELVTVDGRVLFWQVPRSLPDSPNWLIAYLETVTALKPDDAGQLMLLTTSEAEAAQKEVSRFPQYIEQINSDRASRIRGWHIGEVAEHEAAGRWFAAAFHLKWLVDQSPHDQDLRRRLSAAYAKQGLKDKAAAALVDPETK